jgi:hypothetical protein
MMEETSENFKNIIFEGNKNFEIGLKKDRREDGLGEESAWSGRTLRRWKVKKAQKSAVARSPRVGGV